MADKKISKKDVDRLLSRWGQEFMVLVPSREGGATQMDVWDGAGASFLDWYRNTVVPARACFQPPVEEMFRFQKDKEGYRLEMPESNGQRRLIFGIRPCDARALSVLDTVFTNDYEDPYYLSRRKNTLLVGLTCTRPYDSCFCTSLGGSPSDSDNVDLMLTDIGDEFLVEAVTDAGRELIAGAEGLKEATAADESKAKEVKEAAVVRVTRRVDTGEVNKRLLPAFENEDYWEKTAAKCISCGICTLLCPTCYCFDINDEMIKRQGTRYRSCDSCAFSIYTKMPMENPREEKWRRVRQKVAHKYAFYPMSFGVIACTGCGRCIRLCPVNWDITEVLSSLPSPQPAQAGEVER